MKTDEKNPQDWLFLARERLQAADALFQSLGITYSGVELLQEAVERYLCCWGSAFFSSVLSVDTESV